LEVLAALARGLRTVTKNTSVVSSFGGEVLQFVPIGSTELNEAEQNGSFWISSKSPVMRAVENTLERIAPTNVPILLVGESGTGKAVVAERLHQLSARCHERFLIMICSDPADHYFEALAASGERPACGTLFLKEISELSTVNQRSLLTSILRHDAEAAGFRLISSTTANMDEEMAASRFRRDLYYRLKGACLRLPPLRERKEDIPALVDALLRKHAGLQERALPALQAEDYASLQSWHWPGNLRELENVAQQIVILGEPRSVLAEWLAPPKKEEPHDRRGKAARVTLKAATRAASRQVEQQLILDALAKTRWNRKRAAQELQISYKSLLSKLKLIGDQKPVKS
jgi:two-component system response regulator AtoC